VEVIVHLHALAALALGKRPLYPLNWWLVENQNLSRHFGEEKKSHTPAKNKPQFFSFPVCIAAAILSLKL